MKKRAVAAILAAAIVTAMTGCGNSGSQTESATAATTEQAAEVAAEEEWMNDPTAYLSGITASDYVDLPADYASLTVEVEPPAVVTDEEVDAAIENQRQARRELKEVTRRTKVQEGDVVNIDYIGRIDGEEFDGGSAEGYDLEIGSGSFIEGFEEGLIDQKVGDTVTLELTFPQDYGDSTKAGVDAEFEVTINSIQEYVVPQLTDQFVAELGITDEFGNAVNTVDGLRTYTRNSIVESKESQYTQRLEEAIRNTLSEKSTFKKDLPAAMVKRNNDAIINDVAVENVRKSIILKAIGDKEGLCLTDDQFQAELEVAVSNSGFTSVEEVAREDVEAYREILDKRKVMDFLKSKTTVVAPASEEGSTGDTAAPAAEDAK